MGHDLAGLMLVGGLRLNIEVEAGQSCGLIGDLRLSTITVGDSQTVSFHALDRCSSSWRGCVVAAAVRGVGCLPVLRAWREWRRRRRHSAENLLTQNGASTGGAGLSRLAPSLHASRVCAPPRRQQTKVGCFRSRSAAPSQPPAPLRPASHMALF
jgi:hypothetical protein